MRSPCDQDLSRVHVCQKQGRARHGGSRWNPWRQVHDDTRSGQLWAPPTGLPAADAWGGPARAECARGSKREAQREGAYGTLRRGRLQR